METQNLAGRQTSELPIFQFFRESKAARLLSWVLMVALLNLTGCKYYYKVSRPNGPFAETISTSVSEEKTIILISEEEVYQLSEVEFNENTLSGVIKPLYGYSRHINTKPDKPNRYIKNKESNILKEVQVFVNDIGEVTEGKIIIPLDQINKIEMYDPHVGATVGSWILGGVGLAAAGFAAFFIILLIFKDSCPFIYVFDGEEYAFAGEIFSGAIQPQLERHDYLQLPLPEKQSEVFQMKITNEIKEIQHTNLLELWVFDHPEGVEIITDKYGNLHTVSSLQEPGTVKSLSGKDIQSLVGKQDSFVYVGGNPLEPLDITDGMILEFEKPEAVKNAKLVIRAKNSFLLDYSLNRFHELFGNAYHNWQARQQKASAEQLKQWTIDQNIPLSVFIQRNNEWEFVDYYNIAGPMAFKDDVLSIPLDLADDDPLRIKLEYGTYFWEVDYVGVDFSDNVPVTKHVVPLQSAINQLGEDVGPLLAADDDLYYDQPEIGDEAVVRFVLPPVTDDGRSVILHSKGHYEVIRDPSGRPQRQYLQTFREPGQFNRFTIEHLQALAREISE
ncbi:MAG: hypothetical protein V2I46_01145 [Bacteroides sp.]|jgi:hypothetical protein|nr:hypothetical protein [Bacteroides sp.]